MHRIKETIEHYKISRPTLYRWIDSGCPVHYVGKITYFDWEEVDAWIKSR